MMAATLKGTEKQVAWAEAIRDEKLAAYGAKIEAAKARGIDVSRALGTVAKAEVIEDVEFWIAHKDLDGGLLNQFRFDGETLGDTSYRPTPLKNAHTK